MAIRAGAVEKHTWLVMGNRGSTTLKEEVTGTLAEAKAKAQQFEESKPGDGIFRRGHASIRKWTGNGYDSIDHSYDGTSSDRSIRNLTY